MQQEMSGEVQGAGSAELAQTLRLETRLLQQTRLEEEFAAMQILAAILIFSPDSCWQHAKPKPSRAGAGSLHFLPAGVKDGETRQCHQMDFALQSFTTLTGLPGLILHSSVLPCSQKVRREVFLQVRGDGSFGWELAPRAHPDDGCVPAETLHARGV